VRGEFERCQREGDEIDTEFRVRWPDGSTHWLKDRGKAFRGPVPPALPQRVHEEVQPARQRSGWTAKQTLAALGIPRRTYYRWLQEEAWARALPEEPVRPVQPYEALPEEKQAALDYARRRPELRHRAPPGGWWTRTSPA
jgi:hypothetical protein